MNRRSTLSAFLAAAPVTRRLALEAAVGLLRARVLTTLPARVYTSRMGRLVPGGAADNRAALGTEPVEADTAKRIGRMVAAVGRRLPFRVRCLEEAIAVRQMLDRRRVPAAVCLGVALDPADRSRPALGRAAHAWVEVGGQVVSGDGGLERYAEIARFG